MNKWLPYLGSMNRKTAIPKEVARAHRIFHNQRARCYNKNHPCYKFYGAKGIQMEYTVREFVGWWLYHVSLKDYRLPTTGRLDHSANYSFDNMEIQEQRDNSLEAASRNGHTGGYPPIPIAQIDDEGNIIATFPSKAEAERQLKLSSGSTSSVTSGKYKQINGFKFKELRKEAQ